MDVQQETEVAMARAIMQQMSDQTARALKAAMREEMLDELRDESLALAKIELEDEYDRRRERLLDDLARQRRTLEDELENQLEAREKALQQEVREALEERLLTLQDDLKATIATRDQLMTLLLSLVQQLFSERSKRYLADTGVKELDLVGLNTVLLAQGLRVRAEFRHSERQVTCTLKNGVGQRTVFWIETAAPGVAVEGETDGDATATHAN
jgi:hypothetical protein